ncbi:MAG: FmdB family zinc ribbon protein [Planctomycetota bacterium]
MPTYRYECDACGHGFELFQSMTDKVKRKCPECGKSRLVRLIGAGAGVIFKGSGFYQTDYKSSGRPAGEGGDGVASGSDSKASSGGSETKSSDAKPASGAAKQQSGKPKSE